MKESLAKINLAEWKLEPKVRELIQLLLNHIEVQTREIQELREDNQRLRDENARLTGEKGKPDIKANKKEEQNEETEADRKKREQLQKEPSKKEKVARGARIKIDRAEVRKLDRTQLPDDIEHRGYREVVIQNIKFESDNVLYQLERVYSPREGTFYEAKLPGGLEEQRYGNELRAFVLRQYFELRTPQGKILEMLESEGIIISAGEISNIITNKHIELFEQERKAIVLAGLESTSYQNIDDTGGRQDGVNQYVTTICNPYYSSFYTNPKKDSETVARLLSDLASTVEAPLTPMTPLSDLASTVEAPLTPLAQQVQPKGKRLGEYIDTLVADDAKQFHNQTRVRALCWRHEDRLYKKLNPYFEEHRKLVEEFRKDYWDYYRQLKAYKAQPTEQEKERLSKAFDELFSTKTGYDDLDHRIELTYQKKEQMLAVLDNPEIPLHNNEAEQAVREFVIKLKISNGTRSKEGSKAWDIYLSLLGTCRKLGVNFYRYLLDRISNSYHMPSLADLIGRQAQPVPT